MSSWKPRGAPATSLMKYRQHEVIEGDAQGMVFPYDVDFFPGTKGEDGDPLDVLTLHGEPTFPGFQIDCHLIGMIRAHQKDADGTEHRNDRIVAVPEASGAVSQPQ